MKKTIITSIMVVASCYSTQAAITLTFGSTSVTGGTQDSFSFDDSADPGILVFTVSDIDLANDGSANDTLTANFSITGDGTTGGRARIGGDGFGRQGGTNTRLDVGESLTFSLTSASATDGNGQILAVNFDGFSGLSMLSGGGDTYTINGTSYTGSSAQTFTSSPTLSVTSTMVDSTIPRVGDVVVSFSAVPEPSSTALLGLGSLAFLLRRRK